MPLKTQNLYTITLLIGLLLFDSLKKGDRMAKDEEGMYEIMPYKEIVALKNEIEELKKKSGASSGDLLNSMNTLTGTMNSMLQLFKTAAEEMKLEGKEGNLVEEKLEPLIGRVEEIAEQNKAIAEGLVAVADMVKEMKGKKRVEEPRPLIKKKIAPTYQVPPPRPRAPSGLMPPENLPPFFTPGSRPPRPINIPPRMVPPPEDEPFPPLGSPSDFDSDIDIPPPPAPMPPPTMPGGPLGGLGRIEEELFEKKPGKRGLFGRFKKK